MKFRQWLESEDRPTKHRVFMPFAFGEPKKNDFMATDPNMAYRITGQPQIDDIVSSGLVRAKAGKMRGGRSGETQWSLGGPNAKYPPESNPGKYVLVTSAKDLHDKIGGLPKSDLVQVVQSNGNNWIDVTHQVLA